MMKRTRRGKINRKKANNKTLKTFSHFFLFIGENGYRNIDRRAYFEVKG